MTEINTQNQLQVPTLELEQPNDVVPDQGPDSPYRKSRNTIDLTFRNLSYTVKIKNPDRKTSADPKCDLFLFLSIE